MTGGMQGAGPDWLEAIWTVFGAIEGLLDAEDVRDAAPELATAWYALEQFVANCPPEFVAPALKLGSDIERFQLQRLDRQNPAEWREIDTVLLSDAAQIAIHCGNRLASKSGKAGGTRKKRNKDHDNKRLWDYVAGKDKVSIREAAKHIRATQGYVFTLDAWKAHMKRRRRVMPPPAETYTNPLDSMIASEEAAIMNAAKPGSNLPKRISAENSHSDSARS